MPAVASSYTNFPAYTYEGRKFEAHNAMLSAHQMYVSSTRRGTSKTPHVAIDERGLVRSIHLFLFSCLH